MSEWTVYRAGDSAVVAAAAARIDPLVNQDVLRLAATIRRASPPGLLEVVESYHAVTVYFDPLRTNVTRLVDVLTRESAAIEPQTRPGTAGDSASRVITVPVSYGNGHGPDLEDVARHAGLSPDEVVRRHASRTYRVYMLGFLPGFAYLGALPSELAIPRRATPRLSVPGGSVGLAGRQTGIYPMTAPGGWHLIGRTSLRPFDLQRDEPFLFRAGDAVRFEPMDEVVSDPSAGEA